MNGPSHEGRELLEETQLDFLCDCDTELGEEIDQAQDAENGCERMDQWNCERLSCLINRFKICLHD